MKRLFDFFCALFGLIVLMPFLLLIAICIKLDSKGPVFFRQHRVGLNGNLFKIHKFRTMMIDSEASGSLTIGNDMRITKSGRFLRKSKLDELPQLLDVFLGNMSLVGPRPEVKEFIDEYPEKVKKEVLSVRPGITDLASIEMIDENDMIAKYDNPRQAYIEIILPIKQKYYVDYVQSQSLWLDMKIIFMTLKKIIIR